MVNAPDAPAPLSYDSTPAPPAWARLLLAPLGWRYFLVCALASLYILYSARVPASADASFATVCLGGFWFVHLLLHFYVRRKYFHGRETRPVLLRLALALGCLIVVVVSLYLDLPFRAALQLSKPALELEAKALLAAAAAGTPTIRTSPAARVSKNVGLFPIYAEYIDLETQSVHFATAGSGLFDCIGVAYATRSLPGFQGASSYSHVDGAWYIFFDN